MTNLQVDITAKSQILHSLALGFGMIETFDFKLWRLEVRTRIIMAILHDFWFFFQTSFA